MRLCGPFEVIAETRNADGRDWGRWLHWKDHDGRSHDWAMPCSALAAEFERCPATLAGGWNGHTFWSITKGSPDRVPDPRADRCQSQGSGARWLARPNLCSAGTTFGEGQSERVVFQSINASDHAFAQRGELQGWQNAIGQYAEGNSRLVLAISAAFASPLLNCCNEQSGRPPFSRDKPNWKNYGAAGRRQRLGRRRRNGFIKSWRATDNGLESVAEAHCDAFAVP